MILIIQTLNVNLTKHCGMSVMVVGDGVREGSIRTKFQLSVVRIQ